MTFDSSKDERNRSKHGISLRQARELDWERMLVWTDSRFDYGEHRLCGLSPMGARLHFVAFADRDGEIRIISLRKANFRETKFYAEHYQDP